MFLNFRLVKLKTEISVLSLDFSNIRFFNLRSEILWQKILKFLSVTPSSKFLNRHDGFYNFRLVTFYFHNSDFKSFFPLITLNCKVSLQKKFPAGTLNSQNFRSYHLFLLSTMRVQYPFHLRLASFFGFPLPFASQKQNDYRKTI